MGDRSAYLAGPNLGLVVLVTALWLAAGLLFVGPGRGTLTGAGEEFHEKSQRETRWELHHGSAGVVSDEERALWTQRYARLRVFGAPPGDEPALMAWVAGQLGAQGVRGLQVTRRVDPDSAEPEGLELADPFGEGTVRLVPVPIRVRFDASYREVARILARLEPDASALKLRQLELRRQYPGVRVDLALDLWTREEQGA